MTFRVLLIGLLASMVGLAGCQSDEEALAEHLERGDNYFESEQYAEAVIEYKNVLQIDPNQAEAHFGLARSYLRAGAVKEGFWELRETVRLDPKNHEAAVQFAQLSIYAGELEEALSRADQVLADDPQSEGAWLVKGQAHEALKQPGEAQKAFEQAAQVAPESQAALLVLANFHRRNGDRVTAEPLFVNAAKTVPTAETMLALASFYTEDREHDAEAEQYYREGLKIAEGENLGRAYTLLGNFLFSRDRFDDAVEVIQTGIDDERIDSSLDLIYFLARMQRSAGRVDEADALIRRATEEDPNDPRPYLTLSSFLGRQGDLDGALEAADQALAVDPGNQAAQLRKAEIVLEQGFKLGDDSKTEVGRELVTGILEAEPSNPGALFVKAKIDIATDRHEEAVQSLRSTIDVRPDWAEAHFLLGTALRLTGQRSAARTELARALEIDASLVEARRVLAGVHADLGEDEYAVEEARRYLAERPDNHETRVRLAQSLMNLGRSDEALKEILAIPEGERDENIQYALGRTYLRRGDVDQAYELMLAAHAQRPGHPDILRSLLEIEEKRGESAKGIERIQKAIADAPDDARLQHLAGLVALSQRKIEDAVGHFNRAIELDPSDMSNYRSLADVYVRTGRTSQTIETYEKALEVSPDQPRIHHFLAVLYEIGGQADRAVKHYESAIRLAPDLAESKNNLAYLYAESGKNLDRALDLAQDAKALMPDDPNTADTLGWVLYRRGVPSAAVGYLKEAEAGFDSNDTNLGVIRHHLALAYEATGDTERARETADRAVEAYETFVEAQRSRGTPVGADPSWYTAARELRERL